MTNTLMFEKTPKTTVEQWGNPSKMTSYFFFAFKFKIIRPTEMLCVKFFLLLRNQFSNFYNVLRNILCVIKYQSSEEKNLLKYILMNSTIEWTSLLSALRGKSTPEWITFSFESQNENCSASRKLSKHGVEMSSSALLVSTQTSEGN